jgi:hypothetical protein
MTGSHNERPFDAALFEHARFAAARARARLGSPLSAANLPAFLTDLQCLRYRTRLAFDRTGLEPHQFAQPELQGNECCLHVDPHLKDKPDLLYLAVAYMAVVINYGDAATPELAELHGSLLTGLSQEDFYLKVSAIADLIQCPND